MAKETAPNDSLFETFGIITPNKYRIERPTGNKAKINITYYKEEKVDTSYGSGGSRRAMHHTPFISPGGRAIKRKVTYTLEIWVDENNSAPQFSKKASQVDGQEWRKKKDKKIKKSFDVSVWDSTTLKVVINGIYFYFKNNDGVLVLSNIR